MNKISKKTEQYRNLFVQVIVDRVYKQTISSVEKIVRDGPFWKNPPQDLCNFHDLYESLDYENKEMMISLIGYSIKSCVFDLFTYFDGVQGSSNLVVDGEVSDFVLYLQKYREIEDKPKNKFINQTKISGTSFFDDFHDLFTEAVENTEK